MSAVQPPKAASADSASPDAAPTRPVTIRTIARLIQQGQRFACLTCYDATTARWLERAGVPVLLVGDTAAEVILGLSGTIHMPLDILLALTAAVKRGAPGTLVIGDMPFMSYQTDDSTALRNAGRFMIEGSADLVKLEVDRSFAPLVEKMTRAGVPVVAHIGARPQQSKLRGGYGSVGRSGDEARSLLADAAALQDAGAVMLLIEATPAEVAQKIVESSKVPVIGCGAGPACHGQIVVLQDLLGLTEWQPSFAKPIAWLAEPLMTAARKWIGMVRDNQLGEHPYHMNEGQRI